MKVGIIGAGPAGLQLALELAGEARVTLYDRLSPGGELLSLGTVEGLEGYPDGVLGPDLGTALLEQALDAEVEIRFEAVSTLETASGAWRVQSDGGAEDYDCVVLATGSQQQPPPLEDTEPYLGQGVSFCSGCDAPMFAGADVALIGGGPWTASDARLLGSHARTVYVLGGDSGQTHSAPGDNVHLREADEPVALVAGERGVTGLTVRRPGGDEETLAVNGIFFSLPTTPRTDLVEDLVELAPGGYVQVDDDLESSRPGLFAVGDVRVGSPGSVASALDDAATAAQGIRRAYSITSR